MNDRPADDRSFSIPSTVKIKQPPTSKSNKEESQKRHRSSLCDATQLLGSHKISNSCFSFLVPPLRSVWNVSDFYFGCSTTNDSLA
eukprot:scaffold284_cov172-Amphora_coffeaeformis.AAC.4